MKLTGWVGLGLGLVVMPTLAEAQLFPNRTIKREKPSCATEPPFYAQVRRNYYGYYPTCWSRFPAGWGCPCPNPELPNAAASFAVQARDPYTPGDAGGLGLGDDGAPPAPGPGAGDESGVPALPNPRGGSAFGAETTQPDPAPSAGRGAPAGGAGGNNIPAIPDPSIPPQSSRRNGPATTTPTTTSLLELPRITPPAGPPTLNATDMAAADAALAADAMLTSSAATSTDAAAIPAAPAAPPLPDGSMPATTTPDAAPAPATDVSGIPATATIAGTPAQAPPKRGILTGLFNRTKNRR